MSANKQDYIDAYLAAGGTNPEGKTKADLIEETKRLQAIQFKKGEEARQEALESIESGETVIKEITASYSRKKNLGNYESRDFFCSMKAETTGNVSAVAKQLYYLCKQEVLYQIKDFNAKEKSNNLPF